MLNDWVGMQYVKIVDSVLGQETGAASVGEGRKLANKEHGTTFLSC